MNTIDIASSLAQGYARMTLADLVASRGIPAHAAYQEALEGWSVLLVIAPSPPGGEVPGLSDCDRDCLALLSRAAEPLSAERVRRQLEKERIAAWSIATVKRALASLRRRGVVCNSRRRPRGYFLPDVLPLLAEASRKTD